MKKRTKEEIEKLTRFGEDLDLDLRLTAQCKTKYQVRKLLDLQKDFNERSSGYLYLKQIAPKERVKEYEAAIKHKRLLAAYLFESGQLEALHILNDVEVKENEPRAKDYLDRNKEYIALEAEDLGFSKTATKEIVKVLIEYLEAKHNGNIMPDPIAKQLGLK